MEWGKLGTIGGLFLAGYLILVGVTALVGIAIPPWVASLAAICAGVLILVGK